jgi:hypothetical protein
VADDFHLLLSAPLADLITQIGRAVVEAQGAMDAYSLEIHQRLDDDKADIGTRLSAPWLHIPEVELEAHVALEYHGRRASPSSPGSRALGAALVNSAYLGLYDFDAEAASRIRVTFRAVPDQA